MLCFRGSVVFYRAELRQRLPPFLLKALWLVTWNSLSERLVNLAAVVSVN
jgi:hypothetical protein